MRPVIILLAAIVIILGVVSLQQRQTAHTELTAAQAQTESTRTALQAAQTELTTFQTHQAGITAQFKQQVATLTTAQAATEAQRQQAQLQTEKLQQDLTAARQTTQAQTDQLATLAKEKEKLVSESAALAAQLATAQQPVVAPEKTPNSTATHPTDGQASQELSALQARWNSLPALNTQTRVIQKKLRDERIATLKRQDADETATGNHGVLMHNSQWSTGNPSR